MDYEKYRSLENWVDMDAIAHQDSELNALRLTRGRLKQELDAVDDAINSTKSEIRKLKNAGQNLAREQFKIDALEEAGLTGHTKADQMWEIAWERGDGRYDDVMHQLDELAELFV
jgi:hypothetical protein